MVSFRSLLAYFMATPGRVVAFLLCCAAVLYLAHKKNKEAVAMASGIILPSLLLIVLFMNPVATHFLVNNSEETRLLRFFWLIPVPLVMAGAVVLLLEKVPKKRARAAIAVALVPVVLVCAQGFSKLRKTWTETAQNPYKIPQVVIELCDYILQDDASQDKKTVFPMPLNLWVHQYRGDIEIPFARISGSWEEGTATRELYDAITAVGAIPVDLDQVSYWAVQDGCQYVVLPRAGGFVGNIEKYGYREVYSVQTGDEDSTSPYDKEYVLYRLMEAQ